MLRARSLEAPPDAPAGGPSLKALTLDESGTDKAFYAALKLHVLGTLRDGVLAGLLAGRTLLLDQTVRLEVGRFTARKANHLFVHEGGPRGGASAEFHGFTSHKVREKLAHFHELGVVELLGKGLRDAYTYRWREPIRLWEVCSFMRFRPRTADDLSLNLELHRVFLERGMGGFTAKEFVEWYARVHGEEYGGSRWGKRKWERVAGSFAYGEAMKARLDRLVEAGLVLAEGDRHRIDPQMRDAVQHFDLFVNGVAFRASREMCGACPLDALCQGGVTQRVLVGLGQA
jgi:hypothetical protein